MSQLFDSYTFRARLQPALFTLLPLAVAVLAWTEVKRPWMALLWTVCGTAGATYFFSAVVRSCGKQAEKKLWASWGGAPTTQLLRHEGTSNSILRERWHKSLAKLIGTALPTADEERANPAAADSVYEAATKVLISKTRDPKKFPLIIKENTAYGFCRNLYAMRWVGIPIAAIGAAAAAVVAAQAESLRAGILGYACTALNGLILLAWIFRVRAEWVRTPALAYAERLFEATESLSRAKAPTVDKN